MIQRDVVHSWQNCTKLIYATNEKDKYDQATNSLLSHVYQGNNVCTCTYTNYQRHISLTPLQTLCDDAHAVPLPDVRLTYRAVHTLEHNSMHLTDIHTRYSHTRTLARTAHSLQLQSKHRYYTTSGYV